MTLTAALRSRPHLIAATLCGLAAWLLLPSPLLPLTRALGAWDIACAAFLALSAVQFSRPGSDIARNAAAQEEGEWSIFAVTVCAVLASFAAILGEFSAAGKDVPAALREVRTGLVAVTLLLSWLLTHTLFALRYAHEYYGLSGGGTAIDKGLDFPGEERPDYWDFFYFALVLGMTFQVSDVQISSRKLRRLATVHGFLGFMFNTVILALSVNIGASLL